MSDKVTVCAKVEPPLKEQVDQYGEEHELKRSPAIRDLLKKGLEDSEDETSKTTFPAFLSLYLAWIGSVMAAVTFLESTSVTFGYVGLVMMVTGLVYYTVHK